MPQKRKAPTEADAVVGTATRPKAAKTSKLSAAKASTGKPLSKTYKFSNASTLSSKPEYIHLQWPNYHEFVKDKNQDEPKEGELIDEWCFRVSDLGIPMSDDGAQICTWIDDEAQKRNQDAEGVDLWTDWNGWGMSEVMANLLKNFNRDVFKKSISPYKKWAYVEGFAMYVMAEDLTDWMGNEDGETVIETVQMIGLMALTCYEVLAEHSLFAPDSEVKNIAIISLILLEFLETWGTDLDCGWGTEIVRLCDEAGIDLEKSVRKQVAVSKESIIKYREIYRQKKREYEAAANNASWTPEDDVGKDSKLWYRWDWALEYKEFKVNHAGGKQYDLTSKKK